MVRQQSRPWGEGSRAVADLERGESRRSGRIGGKGDRESPRERAMETNSIKGIKCPLFLFLP
jgi:hypothetical protein